jgi:FkbM family methyltransferase
MNDIEQSNQMEESVSRLRKTQDDIARIGELRKSGALGRWWACQAAIANHHVPHVIKATTYWGGTMEIDIREAVSSEIFIHGAYEPELSAFFHRALRPGMTFVDVGAHYGYFSLLAAHRVGETGRVLAIEPCERTSWRLYHNIAAHKQVSLHRIAAWDDETTLTFNDFGPVWSAFNSIGQRRIHPSAPHVNATAFEVPAIRLDKLFADGGVTPDVIKIDAESAELFVLRGLARTISDARPVLTLEVGDFDHLISDGAPTSIEILRAVQSHGYELFVPTLDGLERHRINETDPYVYGNIVAIPPAKVPSFL